MRTTWTWPASRSPSSRIAARIGFLSTMTILKDGSMGWRVGFKPHATVRAEKIVSVLHEVRDAAVDPAASRCLRMAQGGRKLGMATNAAGDRSSVGTERQPRHEHDAEQAFYGFFGRVLGPLSAFKVRTSVFMRTSLRRR